MGRSGSGRDEARRRGAGRRKLLAVVLCAFILQLFVTQLHALMGGPQWRDQAPAPASYAAALAADVLCLAPDEPGDRKTTPAAPAKRSDCPIFQTLAIVSAALAPVVLEIPTPALHQQPADDFVVAAPIVAAIFARPRVRAPPLPA